MGGYRKANKTLKGEHNKQLDIMYTACFCVLWQEYGWRERRIIKRFNKSVEIWQEHDDFSILERLEKETGIELTLLGEKSYHNYMYFSSDAESRPLSNVEMIYLQQRVMKWLPTMLLAAICLALYREDEWGFKRLSSFVEKVNIMRQHLGKDPKMYDKYMYEVTGHHTREFWR